MGEVLTRALHHTVLRFLGGRHGHKCCVLQVSSLRTFTAGELGVSVAFLTVVFNIQKGHRQANLGPYFSLKFVTLSFFACDKLYSKPVKVIDLISWSCFLKEGLGCLLVPRGDVQHADVASWSLFREPGPSALIAHRRQRAP